MRSDNISEAGKLNRFLSNKKVIPFVLIVVDLCCFFAFNYLVNVCMNLVNMAQDPEGVRYYLGIGNIFPHLSRYSTGIFGFYAFFFVVLAVCDVILVYQIRTSLSDEELLKGKPTGSRWTTRKEIREQYTAIPYKDIVFPGKGGVLVSRQGKTLYIDSKITNMLAVGITRSGKGEAFVFPSIDIYSRPDKLENRASMIISDPKIELYRSSKETLESRGYKVMLLRLDDPLHSTGYNPLQLVINQYKRGYKERSKMAARSLAFAIFAADNSTQEPIWKNTATDLFTALIVAITSDCLEADRELNEKRRLLWEEKTKAYAALDEDMQNIARAKYEELKAETEAEAAASGGKKKPEDLISDERISYIPDTELFYEVTVNEQKINCYSCLNFFRELCDRKALESCSDEKEREKLAETALDEYFNQRPPLDYAKSLYQEIKTAGDKTKGSVYINMQSGLAIFALDDIARMTAENNIDIEEFGYGEKPVALFIGLPSEDSSNHFLVSTLISQVYKYLIQIARDKTGKVDGAIDRQLKFILDEFGNFPPIDNFDKMVTESLGRGIGFDIYVQSLNQIKDKYKDAADTVIGNFSYKTYIMGNDNETINDFSESLGKREIVDNQRTGSKNGIDKQWTQSTKEVPLLSPHELLILREGECVITRKTKRTDNLGNSIEPHPIINEYADDDLFCKLAVFGKLFKERILGGKKRPHPNKTLQRDTTIAEEWKMRKDDYLRWHGTAMLYRYQYLTDTFPNPGDISLQEVNKESREHIDYTKMVYEPEEVLKNLSNRDKAEQRNYVILEDRQNCLTVLEHIKDAEQNSRTDLGITKKDTLSRITAAVCQSSFSFAEKKKILTELSGR